MIAWAGYPYEGRVILGRHPEPLQEAVAGFDAERVQVLVTDVTEADALKHAVAAITERFGRIDTIADFTAKRTH
ncbi:hypothetical protein [Streptomyces sp. GESEQ-35]|uniref:hypothetical protein n=1 Tax=Streptomyces sp. GESEQ-35 TaxID=2812657 RepID=UPI001B33F159|nr:hypothetical protein [Streptomyces sp. GESEQ-35]